VQDDDVVYHGYAGHLLLQGVAHVLRVRLVAPRAARVEMAMQRLSLKRPEAGRYIDQVDAERTRWTHAMFGVNWADSMQFDLVLNLEHLMPEEVAELVVNAARLPRFRPTEESRRRLDELKLTTQLLSRLLATPSLASSPIQVQVEGNTARVLGLTGDAQLATASAVAKQIEGLASVRFGP
jgi:osmotically-inducible protein OsmY